METEMKAACRREVLELHRFFEAWFAGELADSSEAFERCAGVLASDFEIIPPSATRRGRATLLESLRGAHGCDPKSRIRIENFEAREVGEGLMQVTYEEWQGGGDERRGRLSSALFRHRKGLPNGVEWLHLHETWLSREAARDRLLADSRSTCRDSESRARRS